MILRQWRFVGIVKKFKLGFTVIKDFEKEHPTELGKALGITIDASIFAHDVLDGFDEIRNIGHGLSSFLIKSKLKFTDGSEVCRLATEYFNYFVRGAESNKRGHFEYF